MTLELVSEMKMSPTDETTTDWGYRKHPAVAGTPSVVYPKAPHPPTVMMIPAEVTCHVIIQAGASVRILHALLLQPSNVYLAYIIVISVRDIHVA